MENPTLVFLGQIQNNLEYVDYELIYKSIVEMSDKIIPTAILRKGWYIDRVRINRGNEIFNKIEDVSYIHDNDVLNNHVNFGRANIPKQAVFYGSILSPKIRVPRAVAYFETSSVLKELEIHENIEEIFTLSLWEILEDIEVMEMIFSDDALLKSEYAQTSFKKQVERFIHLPIADHYMKQGKFFSNQFARKDIGKNEEFKYKISAAYSNYVWDKTNFKGVTYPSVASEYLGQNIALLPEVVDSCLELKKVAMFKFERKLGKNLPIDSTKLATDLGIDKRNFNWFEYIGKDEQQKNKL